MDNEFIARFANEPCFVAPQARSAFEASLRSLAQQFKVPENELASTDFWAPPGSWLAAIRPYQVVDGILHIPVRGVLLHDFPYQFFGMATGYAYIAKAIERGLDDSAVDGIALIINSPGGEVAGCFDLVDKIYNARGEKPIRAYASEAAYSAAYAVASAAETLSVARTGGVGSIGVVTAHFDMSAYMEKQGVKITFIHAGKHKVDGNPYEALPDDVKARIQERIDSLYSVFVATVARNRGMEEQAVRDTEALTYTATEALSVKLADAIGSLDDGLASFLADLNPQQGGTEMSKDQDKAVIDQQAVEAARAEGVAEGKAEGVKAERERIGAIMALDDAKERRDSAFNIALKTDMTVEQAADLLKTLPKATKEEKPAEAAKPTPFEKAMAENENPELGSGDGAAAEMSDVDRICADAGIKKAKA